MKKNFEPMFKVELSKKISPDSLLVNGLPLPVAKEEDDHDSKITYKETTAYDENGEVIYSTIRKPHWQNGRGFVISYTEKMCEFLEKVNVGSTVRVFLYIAHHQQFGSVGKNGTTGIFGYRCSHKHLQQVLRLDRKSVYNALAWLKENFLVHEGRFDGQTEFMVNPNYVTIGVSKKIRLAEWSKRWEGTWKAKNRPLVREQNTSKKDEPSSDTDKKDDSSSDGSAN